VLLTTWGSFGDLHPFLALALGLRERGHAPVLAATEWYREKVEGEGIEFRPLPPDPPDDEEAQVELVRRVMDSRSGPEYVIRSLLMPRVREQYEAALPLVRAADLVVTHSATYGAQLAARREGVPWLSAVLQPLLFLSRYDPPQPPATAAAGAIMRLSPVVAAAMLGMIRRVTLPWAEPLVALRREVGISTNQHPLWDGQFSPTGTLALFSPVLGAPQPDWPQGTHVCGFPFYDRRRAGEGMPAPLARFLDAGEPPVVFALGTSAVYDAGSFFEHSVAAARTLGRRAVLLVGKGGRNPIPALPEGMLACEYAPFSQLFPRAAAIVHQGGVGTTGQALRSGRPQLVVAWSHDQPDNGARVARLGCGQWMPRKAYTTRRATRALRAILENSACAARAAAAAVRLQQEDGVAAACAYMERHVAKHLAGGLPCNGYSAG
jgi:rhamnosyltransferase subunit B